MTSHTTRRFRETLASLPVAIQRQASAAYQRFERNPYHPSLRFKHVHPTLSIYSARINAAYRALGTWEGNDIVWFWIGSHADYDQLISSL